MKIKVCSIEKLIKINDLLRDCRKVFYNAATQSYFTLNIVNQVSPFL